MIITSSVVQVVSAEWSRADGEGTRRLPRRRRGEDPVYNPGPETKLSSGDVMIVLGREDQVHQLREYAEGR